MSNYRPRRDRVLRISTLLIVIGSLRTLEALTNPYCSLTCEFGDLVHPHTACTRGKYNCGPNVERCGPDFRMIPMTDDLRQTVLDLHNELRNNVASGNETRNDQPPATNMKVLAYDMELEFLAQCWANDCNGNPLLHDQCRSTERYFHVGQNLGFINSSSPEIDYGATMEELILHWYNEVSIFRSEWVGYTQDRGPDVKVGHYTQMMWADTTKVGCAGSYYTSVVNKMKWHYYLFACNYAPGGNYISLPVYEIGMPCTHCEFGTVCNTEDYAALCGETVPLNRTLGVFVAPFEI